MLPEFWGLWLSPNFRSFQPYFFTQTKVILLDSFHLPLQTAFLSFSGLLCAPKESLILIISVSSHVLRCWVWSIGNTSKRSEWGSLGPHSLGSLPERSSQAACVSLGRWQLKSSTISVSFLSLCLKHSAPFPHLWGWRLMTSFLIRATPPPLPLVTNPRMALSPIASYTLVAPCTLPLSQTPLDPDR